MTVDEADDILNQMLDFYGRKKLPSTAAKYWCKGIMRFNRLAAVRALSDVWDSCTTMPARSTFVAACRQRHEELFPPAPPKSETVEPWEEELGRAVYPYFLRFALGDDTKEQWANNFKAIATAQGVADRIDWSQWENLGVRIYV
ncbi:MAG: hypothetical protein IPO08_20130 [Xanthomonadales bacterium]|nr:hypothetical protein [Xanthomonadales bacterium]